MFLVVGFMLSNTLGSMDTDSMSFVITGTLFCTEFALLFQDELEQLGLGKARISPNAWIFSNISDGFIKEGKLLRTDSNRRQGG